MSLAFFIVACGGSGTENKTEEKKEATATEPAKEAEKPAAAAASDNPDYQKGLELIAKSDCLTCHKVEEKNIGLPIVTLPINTRQLLQTSLCLLQK